MFYSNCILVLEGENDASYISSFIKGEIVLTHGYNLYKDDINYLKQASKYKQIIVLTDSDEAGRLIRNRINKHIDGLINVSVDIFKCNKRNKHGVAECEKNEIIKQLTPYILKEKPQTYNEITNSFVFALGLNNNSTLRNNICTILSLGYCNNKKFVERLNTLQISKEKLKSIIMEMENGNK